MKADASFITIHASSLIFYPVTLVNQQQRLKRTKKFPKLNQLNMVWFLHELFTKAKSSGQVDKSGISNWTIGINLGSGHFE